MVDMSQPTIYVLADRPGPKTDPKRPMYPHTTTGAAQRLIDLMGVTRDWYLENTVRDNAWHDGDRLLTKHEAISRLDGSFAYFQQEIPLQFLMIVVGQEAQRILPLPFMNFQYGDSGRFLSNLEIICIPHTSGVNRFWNDPMKTGYVRERLRACVLENITQPCRAPPAGTGSDRF